MQSKAGGGGPARLARGLARNTGLKSLAVRHVRLTDSRALGALSTAISVHSSLVALSLRGCGLVGEASGRLVSSVLRAHAARREGLVWSAGLRRPTGVVGHTAAAAPARISTAGCLAVDLSDNRLGDAGVHAVARGLQSDTWLVGSGGRWRLRGFQNRAGGGGLFLLLFYFFSIGYPSCLFFLVGRIG